MDSIQLPRSPSKFIRALNPSLDCSSQKFLCRTSEVCFLFCHTCLRISIILLLYSSQTTLHQVCIFLLFPAVGLTIIVGPGKELGSVNISPRHRSGQKFCTPHFLIIENPENKKKDLLMIKSLEGGLS